MIRGMSTGLWLDYLAVRMDSTKVEGNQYSINFVTPDNGEKYAIELNNATMTSIEGYQAENPDLTITINRSDLNSIMMGAATFDDMIKAGKATFEGNREPFDLLRNSMVAFSMGFEILPGTGGTRFDREATLPFEIEPPSIRTITD
jgi:alkyl sulfatase BDS1-like metallo-beta-lactamase superfamily hydrolase